MTGTRFVDPSRRWRCPRFVVPAAGDDTRPIHKGTFGLRWYGGSPPCLNDHGSARCGSALGTAAPRRGPPATPAGISSGFVPAKNHEWRRVPRAVVGVLVKVVVVELVDGRHGSAAQFHEAG